MIADARMYAVSPEVAALWTRLLAWIAQQSDTPLETSVLPTGTPLHELWRRSDLGCAFMCGYPWSIWDDRAVARPLLLAAPRLAALRYRGRAVYCTDIIVRAESPIVDIAALRGARFGWTVADSQSGYQAPRAFFADAALAAGGRWFGGIEGPLVTPRGVVEAVLAGTIDAGPLDSYWHDLLRRHEPATAAQLRTLASTPMTSMPPLVCAASTPPQMRARLLDALQRAEMAAELDDLRDALSITGFDVDDEASYRSLARSAEEIDARGYPRLQ